jgi:hypothetical protein
MTDTSFFIRLLTALVQPLMFSYNLLLLSNMMNTTDEEALKASLISFAKMCRLESWRMEGKLNKPFPTKVFAAKTNLA